MVVKKGKLYFSFITLWVCTFNIWGKHNILIVLTSENMKKNLMIIKSRIPLVIAIVNSLINIFSGCFSGFMCFSQINLHFSFINALWTSSYVTVYSWHLFVGC